MSTYLRLLHSVLWALPVQRVCSVLGFGGALVLAAANAVVGPSYALFSAMIEAITIGAAPAALLGGGLFRMLSAPRAVGLAPHARVRMLVAAVGVVATMALWSALCQLLFWAVIQREHLLALVERVFVNAFGFGMLAGMASFISSRSPLAMLLTLIACIAGVYWFGPEGVAASWPRVWTLIAPPAAWLAFGAWYLHARRIAPPGWLLPGGQSVFAAVTITDPVRAGGSRQASLVRLLLGGSTAARVSVQWLLAGGLLLGWLLFIAHRIGDQEGIAAHVAFGALVLCPVIVAAQSMAAVRRARALWLASGYSRMELFAFVERPVLRSALAMSLVFCVFLVLLWYALAWHPGLALAEVVLLLLLSSLLLAIHALVRPGGLDAWWRWPLVVVLCWFTAWKPLTDTDQSAWAGPRAWPWFVAMVIATIAFHAMARRRWRLDDLPRATSSPAS